MGLNTKNIPDSQGGSKEGKTLEPGNHVISIKGVSLRETPYMQGAYDLVFDVRGPEIPGFEGFQIDKDDPDSGHLNHKVARVKASQWAYSDGTTKSGIDVSRDMEILKFVKNICAVTESSKWFVDQDDKHETIEAFIAAFDKEKPFLNKSFYACIAGKEYKNKQGYTQFDMYFPKSTKQALAFSNDESSVVKFKEEEHIKRKKEEPKPEFEPSGNSMMDDFGLLGEGFSL